MAQVEIFDLDGTLLDSGDVWRTIDERFLHKRGLTLPDDYARAVSVMHLGGGGLYHCPFFAERAGGRYRGRMAADGDRGVRRRRADESGRKGISVCTASGGGAYGGGYRTGA